MNQRENTKGGKVLVAPLDWGLGHATRCIPIIQTLLQKKCSVVLAGEGKTKALLKQEFPELLFLDLRGYNVQYSRDKWWQLFHIAGQIPKILSAIEEENQWLKDVVQTHQINAVISDNRYGLYHSDIPSVFITHQLLIKTGFGIWADQLLQEQNYNYIQHFTECWVPDTDSENNLAGDLSKPSKKPSVPLTYLGALSRFAPDEEESNEKHLLIILSGPEPQRTVLEQNIVDQLKDVSQPVVFIRGLPDSNETINISANVQVYNHVAAKELEQLIKEASLVISRCGYSTVMDLAALKKKSILIPTPGQTEQEYLAQHLMQKNFALCIAQEKFRLKNALELAASFTYQTDQFSTANHLDAVIDQLLDKLNTSSG